MSASQSADQAIEYSVYVYHDPKKKAQSPWEMKDVTNDMDKAMKAAEQYYETREFQKVEVKKKYFDEKNQRTIDMTLKTLEGNIKKEMGAMMLLLIGIVLCGTAFAAAYFLTVPSS